MNYADANKPTRLFIPQPFASGNGAAYTPIEIATGNNVNFVDGFPSVYGAPASGGGKFITRGEMNAIGRLASQNEFYRACGGLNTFDPDLAVAIGGYPMYAVLQYREGVDVFNVISLKDNNMFDFTGQTPSDSQYAAGVRLGSVDGVNWGYCNDNSSHTSNEVLLSLPKEFYGGVASNTSASTATYAILNPIGIFRAGRTGNAIISGSYQNKLHINTQTGQPALNGGMIIFNEFSTLADAQEWIPSSTNKGYGAFRFGGKETVDISSSLSYDNADIRPFYLQSGMYYSVYTAIFSGGLTEGDPLAYFDSTLQIELQAGV